MVGKSLPGLQNSNPRVQRTRETKCLRFVALTGASLAPSSVWAVATHNGVSPRLYQVPAQHRICEKTMGPRRGAPSDVRGSVSGRAGCALWPWRWRGPGPGRPATAAGRCGRPPTRCAPTAAGAATRAARSRRRPRGGGDPPSRCCAQRKPVVKGGHGVTPCIAYQGLATRCDGVRRSSAAVQSIRGL